ncbi:MAG: hypothetical protein Q8L27_01970 [archaeon]|nr:hypothetical protein [archaeon]
MNTHETEHDKFTRDIKKIDLVLKQFQIALLIECKRPDFERKQEYAEVRFKPYNKDLFEKIIQFINEQSLKHGSQVSARIVDDEDNNEETLVLVPYRGTPKNRWCEETYSYLRHFARGIKDYEQRHKKPA